MYQGGKDGANIVLGNVVAAVVISGGGQDLVKAKAAMLHDVFDDCFCNWALDESKFVADEF